MIEARMTSQALCEPLDTGGEVVRRLVGLQAQDEWIAPYAIRARARDTDPGDVVVNWLMRGTLHMVAAEDAGWLTALLGPHFIRKFTRRRLELGLTDEYLAKAVPQLVERLPGTRAELLDGMGLEGQARAHLLAYAGMSGALCLRGKTYVRMPPSEEHSLDELVSRYQLGYGPATPADFTAWAGIKPTSWPERTHRARKPPRVKLLGFLDPYLLGYKDRSFTLDPVHTKQVQRGGGFLRPVVLVDGRVAGTWTLDGEVNAWAPVPEAGLAAELADLARFRAR
ncbi:DNA glycosylase AlkZ-like family protein [Allorhizocola rhizosphaerae]|uniref:DNA glycosylase AlkZ-like family protein n=1 Tax=Allorhizocola rhizosphaerae TaxID=1872709 RepID=UPI000E3CF465|nr:crosslink repair DNA glycosylase YcaQ family protein [Allorhizocola rhizosphaerae]